jgi:hypothetical protein
MKIRELVPLALVLFTPAAAQQEVRKLLPVPDIPGYKTLKCDFHTHTTFSDGELWPTMRVSEAWSDGLDVVAITDHAKVYQFEVVSHTDFKRAYAEAEERAEKLGMIFIRGMEIEKEGTDIHCNALFVTDPSALESVDLEEALRRARAQGAFAFWNHPGWEQPKVEWLPLIDSLYRENLIQGVELFNTHSYYPAVFPWIAEKGLTALGDSDIHRLTSTEYRGSRPVTLVFAATADAAGVKEALFAHRTVVWADENLWGSEECLRSLWQGAVKVENPTLHWKSNIVRLRNSSGFPFQIRVRKAPEWLREVTPGEPEDGTGIFAERTCGLRLNIARNAPAHLDSLELELEVVNLHTAPGRNLIVRLPLRVDRLD